MRRYAVAVAVAAIAGCLAALLSATPGADARKTARHRDYSNSLMLCLVNVERDKQGETFLGLSMELTLSSQRHSDDQARAGNMSHTGTDGSTPSKRITRAGFDWKLVAENVAFGYRDEQTCMTNWMESPGHRDNILRKGLTHFGSAVAYSSSNIPYYTQNFAGDNRAHSFPRCPGESAPPAYPESSGKPPARPAKRKRPTSPKRQPKRKKVTTRRKRPTAPSRPPAKQHRKVSEPARRGNATAPAPAPIRRKRPAPLARPTTKRRKRVKTRKPANRARPSQPRRVVKRPKKPADAPAPSADRPSTWTCIRNDDKGGCVRWKKCTQNGRSWSCTEKWGSAP